MTESELQLYLHEHIPLSMAMQVAVVALHDESVVLKAPLSPNINHRETVFGGSASALAILAAWSLVHIRLVREGIVSRIVIQSNTMRYDAPISGTFSARSQLAAGANWGRFVEMLRRKGRARIEIAAVLDYEGNVAGRFSGEFVALDAFSGRMS
ncbi:thioesterase [Paramesorhizobium deserti]|uniref:Thioesterase n=1 Tax=Paramesorhizobium deserti TaxID=1494590 RepID=A0A135HU42_9HYPH|nr:YiiD C-terminal domain-containing protein [Paramesorhizobium deserti]KXF76697.1 thioesterase [Paramesorhizobium deserti]